MSDVALLWFRCKNEHCDYVPDMTNKEKRKLMKEHLSQLSLARKRKFLNYVEGHYYHVGNDRELYFHSNVYGNIPMWLKDSVLVNSPDYPIENKEMCQKCIEKLENEKRLFV